MSTGAGGSTSGSTIVRTETPRAARHPLGTAAVVVPLVVIGIQTVGLLIAGAGAVLVGPGWLTRISGVLLVGLGVCGVWAMTGWSEGRPGSRRIALAFLPAAALLWLWDAWRFGVPSSRSLGLMPGLLVVAWLLLFLPVVRRFFSRP